MNKVELIARLGSIVFIGLGFISWMVFTAGFGELVKEQKDIDDDFDPADEPSLYGYWAGSVIGPFVHGLALVHALMFINKVVSLIGRIIGSITIFLFLMYITAIGYGMIEVAIALDEFTQEELGDFKESVNLLFAGGFLTSLFWGIHLAFWPWYYYKSCDGPETSYGEKH